MSAKNKRKINVGIIGTGLIGKKRADAINHISQAELIACYDVNAESAKRFVADYGGYVASSVKQLVDDKDIDLIILAIRHKDAAEIAPMILEKKHLLIEKPVGRNSKETKKIVGAAQKNSHKLFVGLNYHYYPHVQELLKYVHKKKLGTVISSTFRIGHAAEPGYEKTWKLDKELCGGGVVLDPGVHMVDLMVALFGSVDKYAVHTNRIGWQSGVEDEAQITFTYPDGSFSHHHYSLNFAQNTFFIEVVGTKGIARASGRGGNYGEMTFTFVPRWFWYGKGRPVITERFDKEDRSFTEELEDIIGIVQHNKSIEKEYPRYLATMQLVDNLYKKI